ncbi:MAG: plastocyanin/azurin family copper-binding protein, partial [Chloroflexota bacterium]|nr:plastocyanin/azurin family copper-binding protein [Chloroflexota bacterium]
LNQRTIASAPLLEFRQLGADLYVHAVELQDASARGSLPAVKRHAEHLINLIEGKSGLHYGDNDIDGYMEDPGDGVGLLARLDTVTTVTDEAEVTARAGEVRAQLEQVIDLSVDLAGAQAVTDTTAPVAAVFNLARQANGLGVFGIDFAARTAGVIEAPALAMASPSATGPGGVAIVEDEFLFLPEVLTIPAGTTVTWVNDEQPKHTATSDDGLFDTGDQLLGDSYSHTFDAPGIYPYYCRYHGDIDGVGMAGTIVVE